LEVAIDDTYCCIGLCPLILVSFTLVRDRGVVRIFGVSLVAIFFLLLIVCPPSPCGELRGCILVVVGWRLRVKCVCFLLRAHTPLKQKKICTYYQSCCRNKEEDVTYGIRAGSTRDLGVATAFVDMIRLVILLRIKLIACVKVIMVRGRRGGRRRGARGGGVTPLVASTPEGSNPQGGEQVLGLEQIAVGDVVGMMRDFHRMSEGLISRLDRDEARAPAPAEVLPCVPTVTGSIHRELEKVKFPEFFGAPDGAAAEAWLENMAMCFALRDYTSNMKVRMAVFQLKGSALLWWKTLLPQLNMAVEDESWELFEERF
jgi:hypothetical protein